MLRIASQGKTPQRRTTLLEPSSYPKRFLTRDCIFLRALPIPNTIKTQPRRSSGTKAQESAADVEKRTGAFPGDAPEGLLEQPSGFLQPQEYNATFLSYGADSSS